MGKRQRNVTPAVTVSEISAVPHELRTLLADLTTAVTEARELLPQVRGALKDMKAEREQIKRDIVEYSLTAVCKEIDTAISNHAFTGRIIKQYDLMERTAIARFARLENVLLFGDANGVGENGLAHTIEKVAAVRIRVEEELKRHLFVEIPDVAIDRTEDENGDPSYPPQYEVHERTGRTVVPSPGGTLSYSMKLQQGASRETHP